MAQTDIHIQGLDELAQAVRQIGDTTKEATAGLSKLKALCNEAETASTAEKLEFIRCCKQKSGDRHD